MEPPRSANFLFSLHEMSRRHAKKNEERSCFMFECFSSLLVSHRGLGVNYGVLVIKHAQVNKRSRKTEVAGSIRGYKSINSLP